MECPFCIETIKDKSVVCKSCTRDLTLVRPVIFEIQEMIAELDALQRELNQAKDQTGNNRNAGSLSAGTRLNLRRPTDDPAGRCSLSGYFRVRFATDLSAPCVGVNSAAFRLCTRRFQNHRVSLSGSSRCNLGRAQYIVHACRDWLPPTTSVLYRRTGCNGGKSWNMERASHWHSGRETFWRRHCFECCQALSRPGASRMLSPIGSPLCWASTSARRRCVAGRGFFRRSCEPLCR